MSRTASRTGSGAESGKLRPAVILRRDLRLYNQAGQVVVLFIALNAEMGFHLIHGNDH